MGSSEFDTGLRCKASGSEGDLEFVGRLSDADPDYAVRFLKTGYEPDSGSSPASGAADRSSRPSRDDRTRGD